MKPENLGWLQPVNPKTTSMDEMRELFVEQGYLWVKGLIPREDILAFRRKYFEFMAPTGVLKEGTDPIDGIYCGADPEQFLPPGNGRECENTEQADRFIKRNIEAHHSKWLEEITNHPVLFKFIKDFTNWPSIKLLKRQMLRANVPGAETTAVHYDQIFLRYGPPTFLTGWLPFGDIAVEGGGLTYLEDAVPLAQAIENDFSRRAEKFTPEERLNAFNANMMRGGHLGHDPRSRQPRGAIRHQVDKLLVSHRWPLRSDAQKSIWSDILTVSCESNPDYSECSIDGPSFQVNKMMNIHICFSQKA
ncbi:hypothetical protein RSAG8_04178, partial [Rhizoctonia solani AG-8 WAC10335]